MTDKRPIDANALYEDVSRMGLTNGSALGRHSGMADAIAQMIQDAPTIDPESLRGHAKWEKPENLAFIIVDGPDDRFDALAAPWARKIRAAFPAAFVNMYNELILIPKANMYIMLNQVRDERDFKAAVLEDCSRNAFKGCSRKLQDEHLDGINKLLDTKFTRDDIELIYTYLGNGIQHDLCLRFVVSGYDLEVLREDEKKQEVGSDGKA